MYLFIRCFLFVFLVFPALIYAEKGLPNGRKAQAASIGQVNPSLHFVDAGHVANGVGLRNRRTGTITLDAIPPDATILAAYLYWGWNGLSSPVSGQHNKMGLKRLILGSPGSTVVTGTLVGSGDDPCWISGSSNFVYRAEVTSFVLGNGDYQVLLRPGATGSTNGADPWASSVDPPLAEGASLVVIYSLPGFHTLVYDSGLAGNFFSSDFGYTLDFNGLTVGGGYIWTNIGMDGQIGGGLLATSAVSGEKTFLKNILLAGPGAPNNDSDWNGSDGNPLPQLWDTSSHHIGPILTGGETSVQVDFVVQECLVSVANVITFEVP